ncbi:MarR family winged helix-turn-helix transcriptional regulator [Kitasatospora purpeofusca]|uniref:MarR family transcriptional regulator n=1 Tax=Kitasatospora purpeofusca TaxID=67352 RepID=A0ABZ1TX08_9ACTN|nr:MarR family transcriptional regulator [Kitasatospora purpeofusca]MCX4756945.1 MarR family transcriptional regulator [Kitasatospora purpeofusca]MDY0811901.1 MarR family transcriptional regulator [Kitasatospora purpeofusca]WSR35285.1 MarR family transcriptional regulator [Kitasatospora purpeofusca]WSR43605.1 MarR family transcriptional regulator [Kitasatospora purpeofusca]
MPDRETSIATIQRELTAFARRARHKASQLHPDLSLVTYSILDLITERGGCRAADVAAHFMLDKSTVSRQVTALEKLGLLRRETDPEDQRGQILLATEAGLTLLREANEQRRLSFSARFTAWSDEDVARFADYLARYGAED